MTYSVCFNFKSIRYSQILSCTLFSYFWVIYHMVKFCTCWLQHNWVIGTLTYSVCYYNFKSIKDGQILSYALFSYFWVIFKSFTSTNSYFDLLSDLLKSTCIWHRQILPSTLFSYPWVSYHVVKFITAE